MKDRLGPKRGRDGPLEQFVKLLLNVPRAFHGYCMPRSLLARPLRHRTTRKVLQLLQRS